MEMYPFRSVRFNSKSPACLRRRSSSGSVKFNTLAPPVGRLAVSVALGNKTSFGSAIQDPALACCAMKLSDIKSRFTFAAKASVRRSSGATLRAAREILKLHRILESQFEDDEPDLSLDCRYSIFRSGALGLDMPSCALEAFALISHDGRSSE